MKRERERNLSLSLSPSLHFRSKAKGTMSEKDGNTVFIHKLYDLLENTELDELIWWDKDGESFLIRPNETFSRNLAQYFKHTNITSFVRQLNIYGFHKISNDHFQNKNKEKGAKKKEKGVKVWEFKHSNGLFRRGDLESLKLIKRRSTSKPIPSLSSSSAGATATASVAGANAASAGATSGYAAAAVAAVSNDKKKWSSKKDKIKKKESTRVYKSESLTDDSKDDTNEKAATTTDNNNIPDNNNNNNTNNILENIPYSMDFDNSLLLSQHLNQIKYTNLDMLSIVELISKLTRFNKEILALDTSAKISENVARQFQMFEVQIASLKNSILDRLNNSDAFKLGPSSDTAAGTTNNDITTAGGMVVLPASSSSLNAQAQPGTAQYQNAQMFVQHQDQVPNNKNIPFYPKHHGSTSSPMSATPTSSFNKNQQGQAAVGDYFGNVQHGSISNNPFEKFQNERHGNINVSSRRNMSVLVDPLTPASMISVPTTAKSSLSNSSIYNQQSILMYQQHQEAVANGYFSRSEPIITPLPSSHGYNPNRFSDPNLTPAQQHQQQQQQAVNVMKNRASYPTRRGESPLKYTSGPNNIKEEPNNELPKGKQENPNMEQVGTTPSINSPMPVRPPYSRVYSGSSLRNASPPVGQSSVKDNSLILQRPYTGNPTEHGNDKPMAAHASIQRNSTANPILMSNSNENGKRDFDLTLPTNDNQIGSPGVTVKRNSSGVYSLLNTVSEKRVSESFDNTNISNERIEKKQKI